MNQTSMSQKGQVVIPAEIREKLKLEPSTKFEVKSVGDKVVFTPVVKDEDAFGMFTPKEKITEEKIQFNAMTILKNSTLASFDQKLLKLVKNEIE